MNIKGKNDALKVKLLNLTEKYSKRNAQTNNSQIDLEDKHKMFGL